jgi:hypothetical protein
MNIPKAKSPQMLWRAVRALHLTLAVARRRPACFSPKTARPVSPCIVANNGCQPQGLRHGNQPNRHIFTVKSPKTAVGLPRRHRAGYKPARIL